MIAALNVITAEKKTGINAMTDIFKRNKISVELRQADGVQLMYITYFTKNGKINLDKLGRIAGAQRSRILCGRDIVFPRESGFIRFNSHSLGARLCTNIAYGVLSSCPNVSELKVGIYDPNAKISDFLMLALEYCSNVTAVTNEYETYRCRLDMALDEMGATAVVTNKTEDLSDCNIIVTGEALEYTLPVKSNTVILAAAKPKVPQNGMVYYKYYFKMPGILEKIKPDELDNEYFCSALYTLEGMHSLGAIMPDLCTGNNCSQTVKSLVAFLNN